MILQELKKLHANSQHETTQDTHMHKEQNGTKLEANKITSKRGKRQFSLVPK